MWTKKLRPFGEVGIVKKLGKQEKTVNQRTAGIIAGSVVGGIVGIALIIGLIFYIKHKGGIR